MSLITFNTSYKKNQKNNVGVLSNYNIQQQNQQIQQQIQQQKQKLIQQQNEQKLIQQQKQQNEEKNLSITNKIKQQYLNKNKI